MKTKKIAALTSVLALLATTPASAGYIDPGTGSMIFQAVVAGVAAAALVIRTYWHRLSTLFRGKPKSDGSETADGSKTVDTD